MSCTETLGRRVGIPTMVSPSAFLTLLVLMLFNASMAFSQEKGKFKDLDPGPGIAAKYIGDAGIEGDASVIFAENFETGDFAEIVKRWGYTSIKNGEIQAFSGEVPPDSAGRRSLQMTAILGENKGGDLFTVLKPGFDKVYLRFYTRFAADHGYVHHFVALGGYNPPTPWPNPRAGTRPRGDDRIAVFIDPIGHYGRYPPPGIWGLYTYWKDMKVSADGGYWGNVLSPAQAVPVTRGRWTCVELMIKLNSSPEIRDGELALWIDGNPVMRFAKGMRRGPWSGMGFQLVESGGVPLEGLQLRTSMDLKINHLWLEHFVDEGAQRMNKVRSPNRVNRVWFDDIVVATEYIGPLASGRSQGTTAQTRSTAASGSNAITFFSNEVANEPTVPGILFSESFDDQNVVKRGWYDSVKIRISDKDACAGPGCIEYAWEDGGKAVGSRGVRHLFKPTEEVYLRCYIKLSPGWGWTNRTYHPHLMHFLTTENSKYHGPARSHLTLYVEPVNWKLRLAATDIQNKDAPHGLTQGPLRGGYNGKLYDSKEVLFDDSKWHCIEAMFKLNSLDVKKNRPNADGQLRGWFDGKLVIEQTDVIFRTSDFPKMKFNQFLLAPYFGPGLLPHSQILWIDELAVGTKRVGSVNSPDSSAASATSSGFTQNTSGRVRNDINDVVAEAVQRM